MVKRTDLHFGILLFIHVGLTGFLNEAIGKAIDVGKPIVLVPGMDALKRLHVTGGLSFSGKCR